MGGHAIGIELGNSDTCVSLIVDRNTDGSSHEFRNFSMPSYVAFHNSWAIVGVDAKEQAEQNPRNTIFDIVYSIGRRYSDPLVQKHRIQSWPFEVVRNIDDTILVKVHHGGQPYDFHSVDICTYILDAIKKRVEKILGVPNVKDVVITVPIHFNSDLKQKIRQSCTNANLNLREIITNPKASALCYNKTIFPAGKSLYHFKTVGQHSIVIFDLGTGTLDVSVVTIKHNDEIDVVAEDCGEFGESDFISAMVGHFMQKKDSHKCMKNNKTSDITKLCKNAMSMLCSVEALSMEETVSRNKDFPVSINKKILDGIFKQLLTQCTDIVKKCLENAKRKMTGNFEISDTIFIGRAKMIPFLCKNICSICKIPSQDLGREQDAYICANGAATLALSLSKNVKEINHSISSSHFPPQSIQHTSSQIQMPMRSGYNLEGEQDNNLTVSEIPPLLDLDVMATNITGNIEGEKNIWKGSASTIGNSIENDIPKNELKTDRVIEEQDKTIGQPIIQHSYVEQYGIGIDFGTTNSCVAVWQKNGVSIIENEYGDRQTRSVVAFNESSRLIGDRAIKEQVSTAPANNIANIKRLIGRCCSDVPIQKNQEIPYHIDESNNRLKISVQYRGESKCFTPEEITSMVLTKIKEVAIAHLSSKVSTLKAVISVPACFNDSQRKAIKDAGVIAGLDVMQLLNEPSAAAIAYFWQKGRTLRSEGKTILIFDLGGGILDVSIVRFHEGTIEVLAVVGDTNLGGVDFDNKLVLHCVDKFNKEQGRDVCNQPRSLRRLRDACEKAKRVLSTNAQTVVEVDALYDGIDFYTTITREEFEKINENLFKRSVLCVERCLEGANTDKQQIDEVLLVGGSTRIPKIQQLLQDLFGTEKLCKSINADEVVACGAAVQAAILSGGIDKSKQCDWLELQDVTSVSLELKTKVPWLIPNEQIPKYTPIPVKMEWDITKSVNNLGFISIKVCEHELGSNTMFISSDIRSKLWGNWKIVVSLEVDVSGNINIMATKMSTNGETDIPISVVGNGRLSPEDINEMVSAEELYKKKDEEQKEIAAALNDLENLAYKLKGMAKDERYSASIKELTNAPEIVMAWLNENQHTNIGEIRKHIRYLECIKDDAINNVNEYRQEYWGKNRQMIS